jgi:hypothetical protein
MRSFVAASITCAMACALAGASGCSSWDTGTSDGDGPEKACLATVEAFARAAERCGKDYATSYDALLMQDANGDCKNVRSIRDESALRMQCLPYVMTAPCADILGGTIDPTCSTQLQRPLSLRPNLR